MSEIKAIIERMREKAPERVYSDAAERVLGMSGRWLSGSKQAPEGETVYWNACVFNAKHQQIWHGDLNLTREVDALQRLADLEGTIHVTPESPFRFDGFKRGKAQRGDQIVTFESAQHNTAIEP